MEIRKARNKRYKCNFEFIKASQFNTPQWQTRYFQYRTKYTYEQLVEIIDDDNCPILVANDNGKIKGYAFCIYQENKNDNILTDIKTLYLDDLCVDENYRGKHIGKNYMMLFQNLQKKSIVIMLPLMFGI